MHGRERFLAACDCAHLVARTLEQTAYRFACRVVVIDNENPAAYFGFRHRCR
jgi:hypothetical protein